MTTTTRVFVGSFVGEQGSVPEPEGGLLKRAATRALGTLRRKPTAPAPVLRGKPMSQILQERTDAVELPTMVHQPAPTRIVLTEAPPTPPRMPLWLRLRACFEPSTHL
jgi:hypothetical protein